MLKVANYSNIHAKIRGMFGKMLTLYDYDQMIMKQDVKSVVLYLKGNTIYKSALEEINENDIHRGHVEVLLYRAEIVDSLKIARYLKGNDRRIYRYVYRKQEIEDIKKMLRILQRGDSLEVLDRKRLFISKYSRIDFNQALRATTIAELLKVLSNTRFYQVLKPLVKGENEIDLFAAEMALDLYYFRTIKEDLKDLASGKDKEVLERLFGTEADMKNMMWIYRGKHYYDLKKEMLYRYLIPFNGKLKPKMLDDLIDAPSSDKVVDLIRKGPYGELFQDDVFHWEQKFLAYFLKMQIHSLRMYPFSLAPLVGYIFSKEAEINNITTIIEGVRYKVEQEVIKSSLILKKS